MAEVGNQWSEGATCANADENALDDGQLPDSIHLGGEHKTDKQRHRRGNHGYRDTHSVGITANDDIAESEADHCRSIG